MNKDPSRVQEFEIISPFSSIGPDAVARVIEDPSDAEIQKKRKQIREFITVDFNGEEPDALFPLSGGIIQRKSSKWTTLSGSDVSEHGLITIGRARVIAGAEIARVFPNLPIVVNSYNRFDPAEPTMASVVKNELIRRKIDENRIILEEESFSTMTQLTEMIKMAVQKKWNKLTVVTNKYNLPRITAQYEHLDSAIDDTKFQNILSRFKEKGGKVSIVDADTILSIMSDHFSEYMSQVEQTQQYQETIRREAQGLRDLLDGTYNTVLHPEKPRK